MQNCNVCLQHAFAWLAPAKATRWPPDLNERLERNLQTRRDRVIGAYCFRVTAGIATLLYLEQVLAR